MEQGKYNIPADATVFYTDRVNPKVSATGKWEDLEASYQKYFLENAKELPSNSLDTKSLAINTSAFDVMVVWIDPDFKC